MGCFGRHRHGENVRVIGLSRSRRRVRFWDESDFNQDLSKWDVSAVTNMQGMFQRARSFNQDVSKWDVSAVTDMASMFYHASDFNQDLSNWDVSAVTDMCTMFYAAFSFKRELCGVAWVNSKASNWGMFTHSPGSITSTACTAARPDHGEGEFYGYLG